MSQTDFGAWEGGRAGALTDDKVPDEPRAYCWWDGDEPFYIGATDNLQRQLLHRELRRDEGPVPRLRQIARERLKDRDNELPPAGTQERRDRIDAFLDDCTVKWAKAATLDDAEGMAAEAKSELFGREWQPRSYEDRLLDAHLASLDGAYGLVHTEVPLRPHPQGRLRRVDAVHFPNLPSLVTPYEKSAFHRALASGVIELIEIKRTLNRPVIGQLLVARDMLVDVWGDHLPAAAELRLTALVARGDPGLEPMCDRNGIRVVVLESLRGADEPDEADRDDE